MKLLTLKSCEDHQWYTSTNQQEGVTPNCWPGIGLLLLIKFLNNSIQMVKHFTWWISSQISSVGDYVCHIDNIGIWSRQSLWLSCKGWLTQAMPITDNRSCWHINPRVSTWVTPSMSEADNSQLCQYACLSRLPRVIGSPVLGFTPYFRKKRTEKHSYYKYV